MKILLSSASFLPTYGGPAYSVPSLASQLAEKGLQVGLWAPDQSSDRLITDASADRVGPVALRGSLKDALSVFGAPDIFHDSGLWWRHNRLIARIARQLGKPVVVSVRGMLEPAALSHHAWRKWIAWRLYQRRNLASAAVLHVTGEVELESVRALKLPTRIEFVPNGLPVPQTCPVRAAAEKKYAVFIGRLHPIKGLPMLLQAWARIRPADWSLLIAGPSEGGYRQELEQRIGELKLSGAVRLLGPVEGAKKQALLDSASLFVLPSYSENFGIAAGEALAAALPVIATKGTPWKSLEDHRCGWYVDASVDGLESGLKNAFAASQCELIKMGCRGFSYVVRTYSWVYVAEEMTALYRSVIAGSNRDVF